ncbi:MULTISPECIES: hypothetical protein [unclassified Streptomyces]|uniref:hypothetical protein n=1 Tax=unclassified Streptomyces TaxID=2593676 RepID=UPI000A96D4B1|nr:hypothetical protein [Streptomyces sp. TSRI0281]
MDATCVFMPVSHSTGVTKQVEAAEPLAYQGINGLAAVTMAMTPEGSPWVRAAAVRVW